MANHKRSVTTLVNFHLPVRLVERLNAFVADGRRTKVSVAIAALTEWLDRNEPATGGQELDGDI